jgi:TolA-binding protein
MSPTFKHQDWVTSTSPNPSSTTQVITKLIEQIEKDHLTINEANIKAKQLQEETDARTKNLEARITQLENAAKPSSKLSTKADKTPTPQGLPVTRTLLQTTQKQQGCSNCIHAGVRCSLRGYSTNSNSCDACDENDLVCNLQGGRAGDRFCWVDGDD